jgi:hypothetical protein
MSSDVHYGKHMVVVSDRGFGMDMVIDTIRAAEVASVSVCVPTLACANSLSKLSIKTSPKKSKPCWKSVSTMYAKRITIYF